VGEAALLDACSAPTGLMLRDQQHDELVVLWSPPSSLLFSLFVWRAVEFDDMIMALIFMWRRVHFFCPFSHPEKKMSKGLQLECDRDPARLSKNLVQGPCSGLRRTVVAVAAALVCSGALATSDL
jgi:hypothetical protein